MRKPYEAESVTRMGVLGLVVAVACLASPSFGEAASAGDQILREVRQKRHDEAQAGARVEGAEESGQVKETLQGQPPPSAQAVVERLEGRLAFLRDTILRIQEERALAFYQGKSAEEIAAIDEKIAALQKEAEALQSQLIVGPE